MKVVINTCYGGFGVSLLAVKRYMELKGYTDVKEGIAYEDFPCISGIDPETGELVQMTEGYFSVAPEDRTDSTLVQVVEELGTESWGEDARLSVVEIPDDVKFYISSRGGIEAIHEEHRIWY